MLGLGNSESVSANTNINKNIIDDLRTEFLYFYPLDSRHSGRDLVPNHLTFFIFNHSAIFPKNLWPRQIVVNGSVLMDGKKMSKSFGNIIPLRQAVKTHGADPIRLGIMSAAELLQDADFSLELVKSFTERLNKMHNLIHEIKYASDYDIMQAHSIEKWLMSRLQRSIKITTDSMNKLRVRESLHSIIYLLDIDLQWYNRRTTLSTEDKNSFLKYFFETRLKLLAPFAPHFCEEAWETLGHEDSITLEDWPTPDTNLIDENSELSEDLIKNTIEDINNILKVTKIQTQRICIYIPANWKWNIFLHALKQEQLLLKDLIESSLNNLGAQYEVLDEEKIIDNTSNDLAEGKVVGWFQGRMEFGPRALGCRSIIGDARSSSMQKTLNLKIKYRESFRPFAPSVLREDVSDWFNLNIDSPYMLLVANVKDEKTIKMTNEQKKLFGIDKLNIKRSEIPAITHVDYSARIQTVHEETNAKYHKLISKFKQKTGCPVIVNTSFNVRGEPIVNTPEDAFNCFMGTELDTLVIGNCFLKKKEQNANLKKNYINKYESD